MAENHAASALLQWIPSTNDVIDFILKQTNKYSDHLHIIVPTGAMVVLATTVFYTFFIQKDDPRLVAIREDIRESHVALDIIVKSIQLIQVAQHHARMASAQNSTDISFSLGGNQKHETEKPNLDPTHEAAAEMLDDVSESISPVKEMLKSQGFKSMNDQPIEKSIQYPAMESDSEYSSARSNERLVSLHILSSTSNFEVSETLDSKATHLLPIITKNRETPDHKKHTPKMPFVLGGMRNLKNRYK